MKDIYVITLFDNNGNFDVYERYFTSKEKAINWLELNNYEYLEDDEYFKKIGYSFEQHAEIKILIDYEQEDE